MTTYKVSGVDIKVGDRCSVLAYAAARKTFGGRRNMIGKPVNLDFGFSGALDFGDFYLVQNCDGVGSKIAVAETLGKFDTLGYDLLAMVADDAVCLGAETVAITNTIDTSKVSAKVVGALMDGLKRACLQQKVIITGGEIAEVPDLAKGNIWNADALGIVEKEKLITGKNVKPGDQIIGLRSRGFRANGFSLVRYVLKRKFGNGWERKPYTDKGNWLVGRYAGESRRRAVQGPQKAGAGWGETVLTPSLIYSAALLEILGRYGQKRLCEVKALAHVTGGGIPGNITRVLGKYGASLNDLWPPHESMLKLQQYGNVSDEEAYRVWNMGTGMLMISNEFDKIAPIFKKHYIEAKIIGEVSKKAGVRIASRGYFEKDRILRF